MTQINHEHIHLKYIISGYTNALINIIVGQLACR